ncbi:MAG TPA: DMT family transporter [Nocardioidaceae bacterium]
MIVVAVVAALAAACSNSLAAYLQQGANKRLSSRGSVPPSKLPVLVREPRWLLGQVFDVSAFLLQAVALAFGTLVFVEPLLVMSLPVSVGLRAWSARQRPGRLGVVGSLLCVVALSVFIGVAQPTAGSSSLDTGEAIALAIAAGVLLAICLGCAALTRGNARAVAFAAGASAVYGVTAGLTKVVTTQLQHGGIVQPLLGWELYAAVLTGLSGVWLTQNALKPGSLAAPVAVITLGDPLVAIAIGLLWLGESVNAAPWAIAVEVLAVLVMAAGVAVLAHQSESASAPAGGEDSKSAKPRAEARHG